MKKLGTTLAAIALALAFALPSAVTAASAPAVTTTYTTSLSEWNYGGVAYPYAGQLKLQLREDGTISGWYSNADAFSFIPVVGGRNGLSVWLDIGEMGSLHVNAQLRDGKMIGTATQGMQLFDFTASPLAAAATSAR